MAIYSSYQYFIDFVLFGYGIGKYISANSRNGSWGSGAIDSISEQLQKELPGLKGFSARNLRNMRMFYEEWSALDPDSSEEQLLEDASAKTAAILTRQNWQTFKARRYRDKFCSKECSEAYKDYSDT